MIDWRELKVEIGTEAWEDLSPDEVVYICKSFSADQLQHAAQKAFEILWKKFRPNYRMGRTFKALSDKYENYYKIYLMYCQRQSGTDVNSDDLGVDELYQYHRFTL